MVLLGFWNAIRVDYVGWKSDETVTSIWDRLRGAVAVACLAGVVVPFAWSGVGGETQSSTAATEQTPKPTSKSKTNGGVTKPAGSNKTKTGSKTAKGKSAAATKKNAAAAASRRPTAQTIRL